MRYTRLAMLVLLTGCSWAARAEVIKCTDPATGKVTYTNQGCTGQRTFIAPEPSPDDRLRGRTPAPPAGVGAGDADPRQPRPAITGMAPTATVPRSDSLECRLARQEADFRLRSSSPGSPQLQAAQWDVALACSTLPAGHAVNEDDCARARKEMRFRANTNAATAEAIEAAHGNAAAACGLPLPPPVVVVQEMPPAILLYPPVRAGRGRCHERRCALPHPERPVRCPPGPAQGMKKACLNGTP